MYEIIEKEPETRFTAWYCATTVRIPTYCKLPDGREAFLLNKLVDVVEDNKKDDNYVVSDIQEDQKQIEDFLAQLKRHDGKWFDRYARWMYQPEEIKGKSPVEFITWVKEKGYTFDETITELMMDNKTRMTNFHGNLNEYSCSFSFDIFDSQIVNEVKSLLPSITII